MTSVYSVGLAVPGNAAEYVPFRSDRSLFDADVIIFRPTFEDYDSQENFRGHPVISEDDSLRMMRDCAHWKSELAAAVDGGKVIFVMLYKPVLVYYHTGERTHSGTGRNRITTRHVDEQTSYSAIPVTLPGLTAGGGSEIVPVNLSPIAPYWSQFGKDSSYEIYLNYNESGLLPLLATKNRERLVGALSRSRGGGAFVLLPPVHWDEDSFSYKRGNNEFWNKQGTAFGQRLIAAFVDTARTLQRAGARSAVPDWASGAQYTTDVENRCQARLQEIDRETTALADARRIVQVELEEAGVLRWLLFETGKPLERAILKALSLLGFSASGLKEGESEFDAVFTAPEGRCIGEAEGKDNRPINVDKVSQLARNLEEDFARDEVTAYAKGVLFGNAHRLQPLERRGEFFTEKCKSTALRMKAALVRTPDLFAVTRYLVSYPDEAYARCCREAIFSAEGQVVAFPDHPKISQGAAQKG